MSSTGDKTGSFTDTRFTLFRADSASGFTKPLGSVRLWGQRVWGPCPVTVDSPAPGPPWPTGPCPELWSQVPAGVHCLVFSLRAGNRQDRGSLGERTVSCVWAPTLGRTRLSLPHPACPHRGSGWTRGGLGAERGFSGAVLRRI